MNHTLCQNDEDANLKQLKGQIWNNMNIKNSEDL